MLTIRHIAIIRKMKAGERLAGRGLVRRRFTVSDLTVTAAQFKTLCDENLIRESDEPGDTHWYELTEKGRQIES